MGKGIYNVVALETTSMTKNQEKQLESLGPIKITCFLDADDSGRDMQLKLLENLSNKKNKKQLYYLKTFLLMIKTIMILEKIQTNICEI